MKAFAVLMILGVVSAIPVPEPDPQVFYTGLSGVNRISLNPGSPLSYTATYGAANTLPLTTWNQPLTYRAPLTYTSGLPLTYGSGFPLSTFPGLGTYPVVYKTGNTPASTIKI